ncbi:MAG: methionyl-tRNA formyltransferase [Rhizobiaceae bacterium]|nr:methionyl-tRNA formyltransferase [Hyphomicrobiales bacterium]NRB29163.1 methionyl-tRNA formyltransferase [Rhizobiaceae bacterium]
MALRIIFMGTPEFSVPTLEALHAAGHQIVACYTQPPRPAGRRGLELVKSAVHQAAEKLEIPVFTPLTLKGEDADEQLAQFAALNADVAVVVAYGMLLPQSILDTPKHGCFNGHASLLPRWRGAAPIQRAIMAGDAETGIMVMKMEAGLDTGPVALTTRIAIGPETTAGSLHDQLASAGGPLMVEAMAKLEAGDLPLTPQAEAGVTYAAKIKKEETRINWHLPAEQVARHINGLSPFPGAWCEMPFGDKLVRVKILQARTSGENSDGSAAGELIDDQMTVACGESAVQLLRLQRAGSKALDREEFQRGNPLAISTVLP